jgi:hypothetical protein
VQLLSHLFDGGSACVFDGFEVTTKKTIKQEEEEEEEDNAYCEIL